MSHASLSSTLRSLVRVFVSRVGLGPKIRAIASLVDLGAPNALVNFLMASVCAQRLGTLSICVLLADVANDLLYHVRGHVLLQSCCTSKLIRQF